MRPINFLFLFLFSSQVHAAKNFSCEIADAIANAAAKPELENNTEFWRGLARIQKGDDVAAKAFLKKAGVDVVEPKNFVTAVTELPKTHIRSTTKVEISAKIEKSANALQPYLKDKLNDFIQTVSNDGISVLRSTQSSWQLKQLYMYGENGEFYTIRLNHGYRVAFESKPDGTIRLLDIGKDVTH